MEKFVKFTGKCAPLFEANIDTDQIVPKKFLLSIERTGFSKALFYDWRFDKDGNPKKNFVLNDSKFLDSSILIAGANFGCGSSREHAPWALQEYGFRAIIAQSFADIFYNNCFKIGLLPVILSEASLKQILAKIERNANYSLTIDLLEKMISDNAGYIHKFEVDDFRRYSLLNGLDDIDLTLFKENKIDNYEKTRVDFVGNSSVK